jgi:ornithine carbamoyltransferase
VARLGGHPVTFSDAEVGIGTREPAADVARVLSGFHAALGARVFDHQVLEDLAAASSVPIINLLSDLGHPCQALADLKTMRDELGTLSGRTVCWIGDYNNVARSLTLGAAMCGMSVRIAAPVGYGPSGVDVGRLRAAGLDTAPFVTSHPSEAAEGAHAVHTDVWASMGQEAEAEVRRQAFEGFQVDDRVMAAAGDSAIFMHCLPVHRGEEVAASVADGPRSRMIVQAHNRMHAMVGLFRWLVEVEAIR